MSVSTVLVQTITLSRIGSTFIFAVVGFSEPFPSGALIYLIAMITDILDGYFAKKLRVQSSGGQILDLLGDKYLTIISCVYLHFSGIDILPCILLIFREVFLLAFRKVPYLFPPKRLVGGLIAGLIWVPTLTLLCERNELVSVNLYNCLIWLVCGFSIIDLALRIKQSWKKLISLFNPD